MSWQDIIKKEFKIFVGKPTVFFVSVTTSKYNQKKIKGKILKFYGDNYMDMVDMKDYPTLGSFFKSDAWKELSKMSNLVVTFDKELV